MIGALSSRQLTALALCAALLRSAQASAQSVEPPFDATYQISWLFPDPLSESDTPIPGVPPPYGGMSFRKGDFDTLLLVGHAYTTDPSGSAAIYSIGLKRDAEGHVIGFSDNAKLLMLAPGTYNSPYGAGTGLGYGPDGVLFYTNSAESYLAMIEPHDTQVSDWVDLAALTPTPVIEAGPLTFVPKSFPGAGKLKVGAHNGHFYNLSLTADGGGTYYVTAVDDIGELSGSGTNPSGDFNVPTGFGYIASGNPLFSNPALLASQCDFNEGDSKLYVYEIDGKGNPKLGSARSMVSNLCAAGAVIDPQTGDMLFTNYYGYPPLTVLNGFTVAPPSVAFTTAKLSVAETESKAVITVKRVGSAEPAAAVDYSTADGSAKSGINYAETTGTLSWSAGENTEKSFEVPIKKDGLYSDKLTVKLKLHGARGVALGGPSVATLTIVNKDPPPAVSLASIDRSVTETDDATMLIVDLDAVSALPVTVPFAFTGTASLGEDYGLDRDDNGDFVQSISIPAGSTTGSLTIYLASNNLDEDDETLIATMGTPTNASAGAVTVNTVTLLDDDAPPQIRFSSANSTVVEGSLGAGVAMPAVKVQLSSASGKAVTVPVTIADGGSDPRLTLSSPVSIAPGQTEAYAASVADDAMPQSTTSLKFKLGAPSNASKGPQATTTLKIKDNDP